MDTFRNNAFPRAVNAIKVEIYYYIEPGMQYVFYTYKLQNKKQPF